MLREIIEKKRRIEELKKACFDARKKLVNFTINKNDMEIQSEPYCIIKNYVMDIYHLKPWADGMNPEDSYRVVGSKTKYCFNFNSKQPLMFPCKYNNCPMYAKYQEYIDACIALRTAQNKTR